ncbi:hypothetical protein N802_03040 [Knoellia sinensis KCTC 19936]|uniref:Methyltransferase domain-containing protein n=1 Tax=Knoellia sinensis KCTC 19936 TaxID=1385520 RepID=A0A0A0J3H9_9MICO|nr:class I SAM-dependent methyltransferase [Knoellia sinensis]KGN31728.1 hypothetical protein N802_03040 [Knoellia sinensis KCTC 19936]
MTASEVLELAAGAGVVAGSSVLDLCCGIAGPGLLVARESGCDYLGVDENPRSIEVARARAAELGDAVGGAVEFLVAAVPPLPPGSFDVVLLIETLLAFPDKGALLGAIARALPVGGRLALTVEAGDPLTEGERGAMPGGGTVWLQPLPDLERDLSEAGLEVTWREETTPAHLAVVDRLAVAYERNVGELAEAVGDAEAEDLVVSHRLWGDWLRSGRVRKHGVVAERVR